MDGKSSSDILVFESYLVLCTWWGPCRCVCVLERGILPFPCPLEVIPPMLGLVFLALCEYGGMLSISVWYCMILICDADSRLFKCVDPTYL